MSYELLDAMVPEICFFERERVGRESEKKEFS